MGIFEIIFVILQQKIMMPTYLFKIYDVKGSVQIFIHVIQLLN